MLAQLAPGQLSTILLLLFLREKRQPLLCMRSFFVLLFETSRRAKIFLQLDPVLAQGAGIALEDAFFLAQRVRELNDSAAIDRPSASKEGLVEKVLARYDEERLER